MTGVFVFQRKRSNAYPQTIPFVIFITACSARQSPIPDMP